MWLDTKFRDRAPRREVRDGKTYVIVEGKKPRRVEYVDELPVNNYGKILKRELRDRYWKDTERKV